MLNQHSPVANLTERTADNLEKMNRSQFISWISQACTTKEEMDVVREFCAAYDLFEHAAVARDLIKDF